MYKLLLKTVLVLFLLSSQARSVFGYDYFEVDIRPYTHQVFCSSDSFDVEYNVYRHGETTPLEIALKLPVKIGRANALSNFVVSKVSGPGSYTNGIWDVGEFGEGQRLKRLRLRYKLVDDPETDVSYNFTAEPNGSFDFSVYDVNLIANPRSSYLSTDFGSGKWLAHAYEGVDEVNLSENLYRGAFFSDSFDINTNNDFDKTLSPSSAVTYDGCAVENHFHIVAFKRKGFVCGFYQIDALHHADNMVFIVDGTIVSSLEGEGSQTNIWTGHLDGNSEVEVRYRNFNRDSELRLNFRRISTRIVTNANDNGAGSLRQTIAEACSGDTILFAEGVDSIRLNSQLLITDRVLTIIGHTNTKVILDGGSSNRIFEVQLGANLNLKFLTIQNGGHSAAGGGIVNYGSLKIEKSDLLNNVGGGGAGVGGGGAILNEYGQVSIFCSLLSGNSSFSSLGKGGGIWNNGGMVHVENSTISGNFLKYNGAFEDQSSGGGIYNGDGGNLVIMNSTVTNNSAGNMAGGLLSESSSSAICIGSIIAANTAQSQGNNVNGDLSVLTYSVIGDVTSNNASTDSTGVFIGDPLLGSLAHNGGHTQTHALLCGSPAFNAANPANMNADQRGEVVFGGRRDIGAYETQEDLTKPSADAEENQVIACNEPVELSSVNEHASYAWILNDEVVSTSRTVAVSEIGTYTLRVQNSDDGCVGEDEVEVTEQFDTESPEVTCPSDITVSNDAGLCSAVVDFTVSATDNCSVESAEATPASGSEFAVGNTVVNYTAFDAAGNSANCSFTATVEDAEMPSVVTQSITLQLSSDGTASVTALDINNGSSDNCAIASIVLSGLQLEFDCDDVDNTYLVTLTTTDNTGNSSSADAFVTIADDEYPCNEPPSAACQNIEVEVGGDCTVFITSEDIDNGSSDLDGDELAYSLDNNGPFGIGEHTVILTVTDPSGEFSTCSARVKVEDNTAPVISNMPSNVEVCGAQTISWSSPSANDNCLESVISNIPSGSHFNVGVTEVIYTAIDAGNNVTTESFTVTVLGVPAVTIAQNDVPDFCQGIAQLSIVIDNETELEFPLSYNWMSGDKVFTSETIIVDNGTYQLTVTDNNNCNSIASTAVDKVTSELLSAYVILSEKEVDLKQSTVRGGGVGVTVSNKKAKIKQDCYIDGFVQADIIDLDNSSSVMGAVDESKALIQFPVYYQFDNDDCGGEDLEVDENETLTITGDWYDEVKVKENATLIVDAAEIYIEKIKLEEDAKLIFTQPTNVMVDKDVKLDKGSSVVNNGHSITFYVNKKLDVKEGANVNANFYACEDIKVKGKQSKSTHMTGLFLAIGKVKSEKYVDWMSGATCSPAPLPDGVEDCDELADNDVIDDDHDNADAKRNVVPSNRTTSGVDIAKSSLSAYPNPFVQTVNFEIKNATAGIVKLEIVDVTGKLVKVVMHSPLAANETAIYSWECNQSGGIYFAKLTIDNTEIIKRLMVIK